MEYSEDHAVLRKWMPLVMRRRNARQPVAATRVKHGTDVDFGFLTRKLVQSLNRHRLRTEAEPHYCRYEEA